MMMKEAEIGSILLFMMCTLVIELKVDTFHLTLTETHFLVPLLHVRMLTSVFSVFMIVTMIWSKLATILLQGRFLVDHRYLKCLKIGTSFSFSLRISY